MSKSLLLEVMAIVKRIDLTMKDEEQYQTLKD